MGYVRIALATDAVEISVMEGRATRKHVDNLFP